MRRTNFKTLTEHNIYSIHLKCKDKKKKTTKCLFLEKNCRFWILAWSITGKTENDKSTQSSGYQMATCGH